MFAIDMDKMNSLYVQKVINEDIDSAALQPSPCNTLPEDCEQCEEFFGVEATPEAPANHNARQYLFRIHKLSTQLFNHIGTEVSLNEQDIHKINQARELLNSVSEKIDFEAAKPQM